MVVTSSNRDTHVSCLVLKAIPCARMNEREKEREIITPWVILRFSSEESFIFYGGGEGKVVWRHFWITNLLTESPKKDLQETRIRNNTLTACIRYSRSYICIFNEVVHSASSFRSTNFMLLAWRIKQGVARHAMRSIRELGKWNRRIKNIYPLWQTASQRRAKSQREGRFISYKGFESGRS